MQGYTYTSQARVKPCISISWRTRKLHPTENKDKIEGDMEFRGSLGGKDVILKNDKKGNHVPFVLSVLHREDW
jgi:hypothetical protein